MVYHRSDHPSPMHSTRDAFYPGYNHPDEEVNEVR